jgi:hypothetical protein
MLVFMIGASHFPYDKLDLAGSKRGIYWAITIVVWIVFELNALGKLGGTAPGGTRAIYDTHKNAIITGVVYAVFSILVFAFVLAA